MRGAGAQRRRGAAVLLVLLWACAPNRAADPTEPRTQNSGPRTPLSTAAAFLDSAIALGAAPGAVIGVSHRGQRFYYGTGRLGEDDATRPDSTTIYDLASVTKVVAMTTLAIDAVREGLLELDAPIQRYVPTFTGPHKDSVTVRHLLTHSAGLPAWRPLYQLAPTRSEAAMLADTTPLDTLPGIRMVYSDLGIIVMTQALEGIYGKRIDSLFAERIATPWAMGSAGYHPRCGCRGRVAPTELDTAWRKRMLVGEVHDENAARLDGASGHAGLFGSAVDLLTFGEVLLRTWRVDSTVREFTRRQEVVAGSSRALGWDTPAENGTGTAGRFLSPRSFGHTGFTGPSIWIDPTRELVIVVLSNRVHPTRANGKWGELSVRGGVADRVVSTLPGGP